MIVRFETGMTASSFAAARAQFASHGESTSDLRGLGNEAYSSSFGSGQYQTNTVVVRKGGTELLVTGPATPAQIQTLAGEILASV